ncbi:class II histocompatibility antigen, M alpha chain isoform X2 [Haemorhous mexicanus]|nr:class II histocompatibility antigen, M alpha chain isoform X2 [Haemorhous mexicanus]
MGVLGALLGGVLVAVAVAEPAPDPPPHTLGEILTCQPDPPSLSLSVTLDGRGLFWFHFPASRWLRGAPALPAWPEGLETPAELLPETQLCRQILGILGTQLAGLLPQARGIPVLSVFPAQPPSPGGIPVLSVFPAQPPSPGGATTLLCLVENIFPPSLALSWSLAGAEVTAGVTLGPFVPTADLTFVRLSRISVTPRPGDVVSCSVTTGRDNATTVVAYWVAPDTALDEQLDTALAGAGLALGLVLALLGLGLALLARRDPHG